MSVIQKRVSRQAREMKDLMSLMATAMDNFVAVVEINMSIYSLFVKIRIFDFYLELEIRIQRVALVEMIDKTSIFDLDTTTNR
eukprot:scaffold17647_cov83-Skeletonema_dohrnii-CCMP3373.AAC.5